MLGKKVSEFLGEVFNLFFLYSTNFKYMILMWNFFSRSWENLFCHFYFSIRVLKKKLKPPISTDFLMCNVIKVINLIKLPPNDPLPGSYNFLNHKITKKIFFFIRTM